ncbi:MAG: hypothetical protein MUE30_18115, partial [Spirosomaceae bacterium]|jgi:hypothetical protein|nr:hypothetical protein [Spirosomataceae bacterium]
MNKRSLAALLVTFALMVVYYQLWNRYAINIPKWDDHAFKATILNFEKADSFDGKLYELYRQHNEHRVGLTRLVAVLDYKIFGKLNYVHLMLVGNLALLLIWWILTRFFKPLPGAIWYTLPITAFWFSLAFWENAFWGMAAIQNFWVVGWAVLTFWRLSRTDNYWWWAFPMALMAVFTSGNGLLVPPIALLVLLIQKRWKEAGIWTLYSTLLIGLYFWDYQRPPTDLSGTGFKTLLKGFLLLCGSLIEGLPFGDFPVQMPLWGGGLLFFVSFCLLLYQLRSYWKRQFELDAFDYFYLGGVLFTLATAALVAYSRSSDGVSVMLTSRYKVYSALLLSFNVIYLIRLVSPAFREVLTVTFVVAAGYLYVCNQHYHLYDTIQLRKFNITSSFNWRNDGNLNGEIYKAPATFLDKIKLPKDSVLTGKPCVVKNDQLELTQANYRLYDLRDGGLYILLTNAQHQYIFPTWQARKHSFRNVLNYNRFFIKSSTARVPASEVKSGTYHVQWLHYDRKNKLYLEKAECEVVTFEPTQKQVIKTNW